MSNNKQTEVVTGDGNGKVQVGLGRGSPSTSSIRVKPALPSWFFWWA